MRRKAALILAIVLFIFTMFSTGASGASNNGDNLSGTESLDIAGTNQTNLLQPLDTFVTKYKYTPNSEQHYSQLKDGELDYAYDHAPTSNETLEFYTNVPGGVLNGGSVTVNLYGNGSGQSYSFGASAFQWDELYNYYVYQDNDAGILVTVGTDTYSDALQIFKSANKASIRAYTKGSWNEYEGSWNEFENSHGEFAIQEMTALNFQVIITNNTGQTYGEAGTINLQSQPSEYNDQWDWENYSYHSWGYSEDFIGELIH